MFLSAVLCVSVLSAEVHASVFCVCFLVCFLVYLQWDVFLPDASVVACVYIYISVSFCLSRDCLSTVVCASVCLCFIGLFSP